MILLEVKTYVAVCGWCRKESEPFMSRHDRVRDMSPGWCTVRHEYQAKWGKARDIEYCCPDCLNKAYDDGWEDGEYAIAVRVEVVKE